MKKEKLKKLLREELTKTDKSEISTLVRKEIKDSEKDLNRRVETEVRKQLKSGTNEKEIKKIASDIIVEFVKTLWVRKSFWSNIIQK